MKKYNTIKETSLTHLPNVYFADQSPKYPLGSLLKGFRQLSDLFVKVYCWSKFRGNIIRYTLT